MVMNRSEVIAQLHKLECEQNIVVLFACEAGSRSQGLSHANSDNDIKFVYVRPTRSYLGLSARDDTIQVSADFTGWDVQKTLGLAVKSNAQLIEWLSSQYSYWETTRFVAPLRMELLSNFSPKTVMHQFYGNAAKVWKGVQGVGQLTPEPPMTMNTKDLTLVLRCMMVVHHFRWHDHTLPAKWEFEYLMDTTLDRKEDVYVTLADVYRQRRDGQKMCQVPPRLIQWITKWLPVCKEWAAEAPDRQPNTMLLERLCLEMTLDSGRLF